MTSCRRFELFNDTLSRLLQVYGLPRSCQRKTSAKFHHGYAGVNRRSSLCHVVVVDDGSSVADRASMLTLFGDAVEFVFKPPGAAHAGHAHSLNMLLNMAHARGAEYFLYLEDDWSLVDPTSVVELRDDGGGGDGGDDDAGFPTQEEEEEEADDDNEGGAQRLSLLAIDAAMEILRATATATASAAARRDTAQATPTFIEPLVQVHLNSQSAKACAYTDRGTLSDDQCRTHVAGTQSGWPRRVEVRVDHEEYGAEEPAAVSPRRGGGSGGISRQRTKTTTTTTTTTSKTRRGQFVNVAYRLHEWGLPSRPPLQYSGWPGFTLNPAVWSLRRLEAVLGAPIVESAAATNKPFDDDDDDNDDDDELETIGTTRGFPIPNNASTSAATATATATGTAEPTQSVWFDPHDPTFERKFSLAVAAAGEHVGYVRTKCTFVTHSRTTPHAAHTSVTFVCTQYCMYFYVQSTRVHEQLLVM